AESDAGSESGTPKKKSAAAKKRKAADKDVKPKKSAKKVKKEKKKAVAKKDKGKKGKEEKKGKGKEDGKAMDVTINVQQAVCLTFSIKYLSNFAKSTPLSENVLLHMSNEVPLLVEYPFPQGHIRYYLAPKIADE
ncbi:SPOSA6832_05147, partial [Sporobolomyces salmonicolor]